MPADASTHLERLLDGLEHFGVKLGLERTRRVLAELGSPEAELPAVLVAGTNGKGSVSAWLASIVTAAGYRSGLFTSPHLEKVEERLRIDGRAVSTETLAKWVERVVTASQGGDDDPVTYFEALTAAALGWFADRAVDLAVLEVGLGGRLDATNVAEPLLSVITPIAFDHQRQLGSTLGEIAAEKGGILRAGRPAIASTDQPDVRRALVSIAAGMGSRLEVVHGHGGVLSHRDRPGGAQTVTLRTDRHTYRLESRLGGRHQLDNLELAVRAAERLSEVGLPDIDRRAIEEGVAACRWPGRLEWIALGGAGGGRQVLLDAAHNPAGLLALGAYLGTLGRPFSLVFGMLREKVDPHVVGELWKAAERVVVTRPSSERALAPAELVAEVGIEPDLAVAEPRRACERALAADNLVVVCGSIYLAGEVRTWLRERYGVPAWTEQIFGLAGG